MHLFNDVRDACNHPSIAAVFFFFAYVRYRTLPLGYDL